VDNTLGETREPGKKSVTLHGNYDELSAVFRKLVDDYIQTKYPPRFCTWALILATWGVSAACPC
jgi:hypothetical protein